MNTDSIPPLVSVGAANVPDKFIYAGDVLSNLDNRCWNQFRVDYSVMQLEEKFKQEDYIKKISIPLFEVIEHE